MLLSHPHGGVCRESTESKTNPRENNLGSRHSSHPSPVTVTQRNPSPADLAALCESDLRREIFESSRKESVVSLARVPPRPRALWLFTRQKKSKLRINRNTRGDARPSAAPSTDRCGHGRRAPPRTTAVAPIIPDPSPPLASAPTPVAARARDLGFRNVSIRQIWLETSHEISLKIQ